MANTRFFFAFACVALIGFCAVTHAAENQSELNAVDEVHAAQSSLRSLRAYAGCDAIGNVCTVDNGNGTSTTCVHDADGYSHCTTHNNGEGAPYKPTPTGRKMHSLQTDDNLTIQRRALKVYTGCTGGPNSQTCTVDNHNGTSTVCVTVTTPYHQSCSTYKNGA